MSDLLGDPKTDRTLEETVTFIAQKELGKVTKSAVVIRQVPHLQALKIHQIQGCHYLNWNAGHEAIPLKDKKNDCNARSRFCEAWTFTCGKCSTKGHYTKKAANVPLGVSGVIETPHLERAVMVMVFEADLIHMFLKGSPKKLWPLQWWFTNYVWRQNRTR